MSPWKAVLTTWLYNCLGVATGEYILNLSIPSTILAAVLVSGSIVFIYRKEIL